MPSRLLIHHGFTEPIPLETAVKTTEPSKEQLLLSLRPRRRRRIGAGSDQRLRSTAGEAEQWQLCSSISRLHVVPFRLDLLAACPVCLRVGLLQHQPNRSYSLIPQGLLQLGQGAGRAMFFLNLDPTLFPSNPRREMCYARIVRFFFNRCRCPHTYVCLYLCFVKKEKSPCTVPDEGKRVRQGCPRTYIHTYIYIEYAC